MTQTPTSRPSLVKQLGGALAGMSIALGLYGAYQFTVTSGVIDGATKLTASVFLKQETTKPDARFSDKKVKPDSVLYQVTAARIQNIQRMANSPKIASLHEEAVSSVEAEIPSEATSADSTWHPVALGTGEDSVSSESMGDSSRSKPTQKMVAKADAHGSAPKLPSSGITEWFVAALALLIALAVTPKTRNAILLALTARHVDFE